MVLHKRTKTNWRRASPRTSTTGLTSTSASACLRRLPTTFPQGGGRPAERERHSWHGTGANHGEENYDLINAGKQAVTPLPGGAFFHHADSFAIMRGGHIDICVLGAFQVSSRGDLANWSTGEPGAISAVGGAMDLAIGAKQTWVMMDLLTKKGASKSSKPAPIPSQALPA